MSKKNKQFRHRVILIGILLPAVMIAGLMLMGWRTWRQYSNSMIDSQTRQMLTLAQSVAQNVKQQMDGYWEDLKFLETLDRESGNVYKIRENFFACNDQYIVNYMRQDSEGKIRFKQYPQNITPLTKLSNMNSRADIWMYEDTEGEKYLVFRSLVKEGEYICLVVDAVKYYNNLLMDVRVGKEGYIAITNSKGIIVMHPDRKQWGCDQLEDRRTLYGSLDLDDVENKLLIQQQRGESGVVDYESYWWTDRKVPKVHKINAFYPAYFSTDFWTVSAVSKYDDFYEPIQHGAREIISFFFAILLLFLIGAAALSTLLVKNRRSAEQITYLQDLNHMLEQVRSSEESIAHQQRLKIMGTMTGGIAHEFNNFLTPILGHSELLMMDLTPDTDQYESAEEIHNAAIKAKNVVKQMSSFSRKNVETVYKNIPARRLIIRAGRMIEAICPVQVQLVVDNQLKDEIILGNSTQINQIILNMSVNSVQAIGDASGRITLGARALRREDCLYPEMKKNGDFARYVEISVSDNGCGMTRDVMNHIFDPFFTTKKTGEGTGLGLALVEQIIRSHRGFIHVESEIGAGTSIYVYLPALDKSDSEIAAEEDEEEKYLIIVDDNRKILSMIRGELEARRVNVVTCFDQEELTLMIKSVPAMSVIVDETIGNKADGISALMAIGALAPDIPRILMADTVTYEIVEAKERGVIDDWLIKPVAAEQIMDAVETNWRKKHPVQDKKADPAEEYDPTQNIDLFSE